MILTCKQCKESYDTAWGYHNDDYCTSSCHIESLEAEVARLREFKEFVNMMIRRNLNHTCADYEAIMAIDEKLLKASSD